MSSLLLLYNVLILVFSIYLMQQSDTYYMYKLGSSRKQYSKLTKRLLYSSMLFGFSRNAVLCKRNKKLFLFIYNYSWQRTCIFNYASQYANTVCFNPLKLLSPTNSLNRHFQLIHETVWCNVDFSRCANVSLQQCPTKKKIFSAIMYTLN